MPVDTSIYGNLLRSPKSVSDYGAEMDQAASAQLGLQQGQMNLLSAKQAQQDEQALRKLYQDPSFNPTTPEGLQQLYKVGGPKVGMAYQKSALDMQKTQADIASTQSKTKETGVDIAGKEFDQKTKRTQQHVQGLASVTDVPAALRWLDEAKASGELPPDKVDEIKAQISAGKLPLAQWRQQAFTGGMTVIEQQKAQEEARKQAETERNNIEQNKIARGQLGVSQGQLGVAQGNLGVARANLNLRQQELSKPFEVTGPDGTPQLAQQNKQGQIVPVEGYAPKSATNTKPLAGSAAKQLVEARDNAATIDRLTTSFDEKFAGKGVLGLGADASMAVKGVFGTDEKSVDWWKNYRKQAELTERHALFGAALTPTEQASWQSADIHPSMDAKVIKKNLETRQALSKKIFENTQQDLIDAGHNEKRIKAIAGRNTDIEPTKPQAVKSEADYQALPSGATYIAPDGSTRTKR